MSEVSNPNLNVTRQDLADFYDKIFPYLGGRANAGFTPVGTIISVMGVNAPANYLKCDGTVYNISDYPELATYFGQQFNMVNKFGGNGTTTFAVPDLQGQFLRGTGTNSDTTQGSGSYVGARQQATEIPNITIYTDTAGTGNLQAFGAKNNSTVGPVNPDASLGTSGGHTYVETKATTDSTTLNKYTTRPTNTSVLFCIATKNIYMNPSLDYSTDETAIGTWHDGKTIYQRVLSVTLPSTTDGTLVGGYTDITSLNVETAVKVTGVGQTSAYCVVFDSVFITNSGGILKVLVDSNKTHLTAYTDVATYSNKTYNVILQYTKTTD